MSDDPDEAGTVTSDRTEAIRASYGARHSMTKHRGQWLSDDAPSRADAERDR